MPRPKGYGKSIAMSRKFGELPLDAEPVEDRKKKPKPKQLKQLVQDVQVPSVILERVRRLCGTQGLVTQRDVARQLQHDYALERALGRRPKDAEIAAALYEVHREQLRRRK